jgi:hypothetical protein
MNTSRIIWLALLAATLALLLSASASAWDLSGLGVDLSWTVLGAGGGRAAWSTYSLDATLGQPFVGIGSGSTAHLSSGFWQENTGYRVYLPMVVRDESTLH